jgi:hypothetical protein
MRVCSEDRSFDSFGSIMARYRVNGWCCIHGWGIQIYFCTTVSEGAVKSIQGMMQTECKADNNSPHYAEVKNAHNKTNIVICFIFKALCAASSENDCGSVSNIVVFLPSRGSEKTI